MQNFTSEYTYFSSWNSENENHLKVRNCKNLMKNAKFDYTKIKCPGTDFT